MRLPLVAVSAGVALVLTGLAVPHGGYLVVAGFCFALAGFLRALAVRRTVGARNVDPYAIGYGQVEEAREEERSPEQLRNMLALAEARVEEMERSGFESGADAARGIRDAYRAALERAERRAG